jgi:UDP-N-acetylglucosamine--N-acetylmuramyl-(pentapeptide) pyrophosphoryl-undecaprenol N-acetylglucosamine transferase
MNRDYSAPAASARVAIAAGGTGGHIAPALALAEALRHLDPGAELFFLCGNKPLESRMYEAAGHRPVILDSRPLTGRDPLALARAAMGIAGAVWQARRILASMEPSVVVGMGGYVAAPAILAARTLSIPAYLHEQNAIPGRANWLLSRFAAQTSAAHPEALESLGGRKRRVIGNPLCPNLFEATREQGMAAFGLSAERPVILVLGGSQGAEGLNELIFDAASRMADRLPAEMVPQFLWAAGERHADRWSRRASEAHLEKVLFIRGFISDMPLAYAAADLAVSRAGAGTIAELTALGLPSILAPYPHARDDHQTANARRLMEAGAAIVESEARLTPALLAARIEQLLFSPGRLTRMSAAARSLARPDAAWEMARLVLDMARPARPAVLRERIASAPQGALAV